jgi:hypothetical protein
MVMGLPDDELKQLIGRVALRLSGIDAASLAPMATAGAVAAPVAAAAMGSQQINMGGSVMDMAGQMKVKILVCVRVYVRKRYMRVQI